MPNYLISCEYDLDRRPGGGWSEQFLRQPSSLAVAQSLARDYMAITRGVRGTQTLAIGTRITNLDVAGSKPVIEHFDAPIAGTAGDTDSVFQAAEFLGNTSKGAKRTFRVAGLADGVVVKGKLDRTNLAVLNFLSQMQTFVLGVGYIFQRDQTQTKYTITAIQPDGTVTTSEANPFSKNDRVQLLRVRNANGRDLSGDYTVKAIPADAFNFQVANWGEAAPIYDSGKVRLIVKSFVVIDTFSFNRVVARKVGRPFDLPRARKFKRKVR